MQQVVIMVILVCNICCTVDASGFDILVL